MDRVAPVGVYGKVILHKQNFASEFVVDFLIKKLIDTNVSGGGGVSETDGLFKSPREIIQY